LRSEPQISEDIPDAKATKGLSSDAYPAAFLSLLQPTQSDITDVCFLQIQPYRQRRHGNFRPSLSPLLGVLFTYLEERKGERQIIK
jgi:hypothetical protein